MILFDNKYYDVEVQMKDAIKKEVCGICSNTRGIKNCLDKYGYPCDLLDPIILTVIYNPVGDNSCTRCKHIDSSKCWVCSRCFDDSEHYNDFYEVVL